MAVPSVLIVPNLTLTALKLVPAGNAMLLEVGPVLPPSVPVSMVVQLVPLFVE
jgi:hypothetical protein